jgi:hypothetical protein
MNTCIGHPTKWIARKNTFNFVIEDTGVLDAIFIENKNVKSAKLEMGEQSFPFTFVDRKVFYLVFKDSHLNGPGQVQIVPKKKKLSVYRHITLITLCK